MRIIIDHQFETSSLTIRIYFNSIIVYSLTIFRNPVSSMVFGINALITKPAQSLSPMIVVYILKQSGYKVIQLFYFRLFYVVLNNWKIILLMCPFLSNLTKRVILWSLDRVIENLTVVVGFFIV